MRGSNVKNIYILNSQEFQFNELSKYQIKYIESIADKTKYNELRNLILRNEGDNVKCIIKIKYPEQQMSAFNEFGVELIYNYL
jgi:hypothetical protein